MTLLTQAQQLLQQTPYTLQTCRDFAKLEQQAKGDELEQIAELMSALIAGLDQQTHMQAFDEGLV